MSLTDYILIAVIALLFIAAVRSSIKKKAAAVIAVNAVKTVKNKFLNCQIFGFGSFFILFLLSFDIIFMTVIV